MSAKRLVSNEPGPRALERGTLNEVLLRRFEPNEVSSMFQVSKARGSVVSRAREAGILETFAQSAGITLKNIPIHLKAINLDRSGLILGAKMRPVYVDSLMSESLLDDGVSSIATFLVLVLQFVETPRGIAKYLARLLDGAYSIFSFATDKPLRTYRVLYSIEEILVCFVSAVMDSDSDSKQHHLCLQLMSKLALAIGGADRDAFRAASVYAQQDHERFVQYLLNGDPNVARGQSTFHTLSAGTAMLGLAAYANGVPVRVVCVSEKESKGEVLVPLEQPDRSRLCLSLWLVEPPPEVRRQLNAARCGFDQLYELSSPLPQYGGSLEIALVVAQHLKLPHETRQELVFWDWKIRFWKEAVREGAKACWRSQYAPRIMIRFAWADSFLDDQIPSAIAPAAKQYFEAPRNDPLHQLAKKAAIVLHRTIGYGDYDAVDERTLKSYLKYIIIGLFVGSLRSLVSNSENGQLTHRYAWTLDCEVAYTQAQTLVNDGMSPVQVLLQAARIWGGLKADQRPHLPETRHPIGIVCPEVVIVFDVLHDPQRIAFTGLKGGLFSIHRGSTPMLPAEVTAGFITAGRPDTGNPHAVDTRGLSHKGNEPQGALVFSAEVAVSQESVQSMVLCVWNQGAMLLELDPSVVQGNLLGTESLSTFPDLEQSIELFGMRELSRAELSTYRSGFSVVNGTVWIDASEDVAWRVVSAGSHLFPRTVVLKDREALLALTKIQKQTQKKSEAGWKNGGYVVIQTA